MDILQDIDFYKLTVAIFIPLLIFLAIFRLLNRKNKTTENTEGATPPTQNLHHHSLKQNLPKYSSQKNKDFTDSITEEEKGG